MVATSIRRSSFHDKDDFIPSCREAILTARVVLREVVVVPPSVQIVGCTAVRAIEPNLDNGSIDVCVSGEPQAVGD